MVFQFFSDLQFKQRTGNLKDVEAFTLGFVYCLILYAVIYMSSIESNGNINKVYMKKYNKYIYSGPFICGLIYVFINFFRKGMTEARLNTYKGKGMTDKEALSEVLADSRTSSGGSYSFSNRR